MASPTLPQPRRAEFTGFYFFGFAGRPLICFQIRGLLLTSNVRKVTRATWREAEMAAEERCSKSPRIRICSLDAPAVGWDIMNLGCSGFLFCFSGFEGCLGWGHIQL